MARHRFGMTPLHLAVSAYVPDPATIAGLLDAGANPSAEDGNGRTPWNYAKGDADLVGTGVYERMRVLVGE